MKEGSEGDKTKGLTSPSDDAIIWTETKGAFHSAQNSRNFGQKSNGTEHFGSVWNIWNIWDHFWRWSLSIGQNTALLYNNNQTRCGLGRVCVTGMYRSIGHVEFPKISNRKFFWIKSAQGLTSQSAWSCHSFKDPVCRFGEVWIRILPLVDQRLLNRANRAATVLL